MQKAPKNQKSKTFSFRISPKTEKQLNELSLILGDSKAQIIEDLIESGYDKVTNNAEVKSKLKALTKLQKELEKIVQ